MDDEKCATIFSHKNPVLHAHRRPSAAGQACSPLPSPITSPNGKPVWGVPASVDETTPVNATTSSMEQGQAWQSEHAVKSQRSSPHMVPSGISQASAIGAVQPSLSEMHKGGAAVVHGTVFGLINFVVCVPTLISYAAIVFRLEAFNGDMPSLTKLFFLSSAVHQLVFTLRSSLPFAVGQVQDVGLIFLSQISTHTYLLAQAEGLGYNEILATVLVNCALATILTGALVWLVGRMKLSGYVQLLPLPVVGGYLGYIGYFCLAAGASLGTGLTIDGFGTWLQVLVWDPMLWAKLSLSIAFALFLFYVAYNIEHVAALPSVLVVTPILFFVVMWVSGMSLDEARDQGWVPRPDENPAAGWNCFKLYNNFEGIAWWTLPAQTPKLIGLFCVVCFGSVLDIAAIQTEQPAPLDFDGELKMIGFSNIASGATGGFTGSYIFSQTIFTQRQRVTSAANGWVVAIGEFILFLMPLDVLQFFPGFYIGGVMAFFGIDIMLDWLVHSRSKVSLPEYGLLLLTFFFVMFLGVIEGCAAGVAASALVFIIVYSSTPAVDVRTGLASTAMRSFDERTALVELRRQIVVLELKGYLFFGAALQVSDKLLREIGSLGARWVVLDFTQVAGVDSTSARALAKFVVALRSQDICLAFSALEPHTQTFRLLNENGAMPQESDLASGVMAVADHLDGALAWCERGAIRFAGVQPVVASLQLAMTTPGGTEVKFEHDDMLTLLLREYTHPVDSFSSPHALKTADRSTSRQLEDRLRLLARAMEQRKFAASELLFEAGARCDGFMLVVEGVALSEGPTDASEITATGRFTFEAGSLLGDVDFHLGAPHSYTARAGPQGCVAAVLSREALERLEETDPRTAVLAQRVALRSVCLLTQATVGIFVKTGSGSVV